MYHSCCLESGNSCVYRVYYIEFEIITNLAII